MYVERHDDMVFVIENLRGRYFFGLVAVYPRDAAGWSVGNL
jgi:hypothetical protein